MFQTVIFDLDGTLLDTMPDLMDAGNHVCQQMGWPQRSIEAYRVMVGIGMRNLLQELAPAGAQDPALDDAIAEYLAYYGTHNADKTLPYPGISALLNALQEKGIRMAICSNKSDEFSKKLAEHYFPGVFQVVRGRIDGFPGKPDPAGVKLVMEALGAEPSATLYVGDSSIDMATAHNSGIASCGVSWGFRGRQELEDAGAEYIVDTAEELLALILA